ncbi:UDP-N-acetylmuramate dehydrogenase [Helicobacter saguini]|nr:UDP-N-acetylmuramate dehydrogenase [Helicobacter saguini]
MQKIIINFQKYSSIKIGGENKVSIIEMCDVGGSFVNFIESSLDSKKNLESSLDILKNLPLDSNLDSKDSNVELSKNKTSIFHNKTLNFNQILQSKKISNITLDSKNFHIIGKGNNLLVAPTASNLAILSNEFNYISVLQNLDSNIIEIGATAPSVKVFLFFKKHNLQGLEFLQHLPGNIGGLCNMNAGMKSYEIANFLHSININGEWINARDVGLIYRGRESKGVIFAARFKAIKGFRNDLLESFKKMRTNQPKIASCGSCFKNPPNDYAGRLIEVVGLKGFFLNGVGFSEIHANFLVNKNVGNASFKDAINAINIAKSRVKEQFNITLECEVKICN